MIEDLRELYQQVILDHNKAPRNYGKLDSHTHYAEGDNPLCGDHIDLFIKVDGENKIADIGFEGNGCAISKASASLMTAELKGKTLEEAEVMFKQFHDMVTKDDVQPDYEKMGKLVALAGVKEFPIRVKCASLAWHTLFEAVKESNRTATSE